MLIARICGGAAGGNTSGVGIGDGDVIGEAVGVMLADGDGDAEGSGAGGVLCAKAAKGTLAKSSAKTIRNIVER